MIRALLISLLMLFSVQGYADILFLDLNGNPKEIEAAKAAADKRGEKVIVLPVVTTEMAAQQRKLKDATQKANEAYGKAGCYSKIPSAACQTADKNLNEAMKAETDFRNKNSLNSETLSKGIADLKNRGVELSSIVLSGHDGNGHFAGTYGDLTDKGLAEAFQNNPPMGDSIRSMALWGCYTANIGSLSQYWKKAMPNVEIIAGYDRQGPLGNSPSNWAYLKDFLIKEKDLTAIKDERELQKALNGINGTNITAAAICVGDKYASKTQVADLGNMAKLCEGAYLTNTKVFSCYMNAEKGCENPPANTSSSELRTFYEHLQEYAHCSEVLTADQKVGMPSGDTMIRLIHYADVKKNFVNNFSREISDYNSLLDKVGAPKDLRWGDIQKMTRAEILAKLNATASYISDRGREDSALNPEFTAIRNFLSMGLQPILGDINVPFNWVETATAPESMANAMKIASVASVNRLRTDYENDRAKRLMNEKLETALKENPSTKSQMESITKKAEELQKRVEAGANFRDVMGPFQDLEDEKNRLIRSNWGALAGDLEQYKKGLQSADYANAEGKKIFNAKLEDVMSQLNNASKQK